MSARDVIEAGIARRLAWVNGSLVAGELLSDLTAAGYRIVGPGETTPGELTGADDDVANLFVDAWAEADRAMRKFPQPNYVISKVAEEAGEVVKAAIHCAEGREMPENVVAEIRQAMAMLIRLYVEGDQVHGLPPLAAAIRAMVKP